MHPGGGDVQATIGIKKWDQKGDGANKLLMQQGMNMGKIYAILTYDSQLQANTTIVILNELEWIKINQEPKLKLDPILGEYANWCDGWKWANTVKRLQTLNRM